MDFLKKYLYFFISVSLAFLFFSCSDKGSNSAKPSHQVQSILDKAAIAGANGNAFASIKFLDSALAGKYLSITDKAKVYGFKCDIYNNQLHDYRNANLYADSLLYLIEKSGTEKYKTEYAIANYTKGDVLFNQQLYNEAYTYYYKARAIGKVNVDSCTLSEYNFRLGMVLFKQSRFDDAARMFYKSYNGAKTCAFEFGKFARMQQLLNNTGLSYYRAGMIDSAAFFYNKAISFIAEHRQTFFERKKLIDIAEAVIIGNMANINIIRGDTANAKQLLKQSIAINTQQGGDYKDAQYSQVKLAEIYSQEGFTDSSFTILQQLRSGLDTVRNTKAEMDWNRLMWKYYDKKRNIQQAYTHLLLFNEFTDSLKKENSGVNVVDLSQRMKMLESQYEIQTLQKNNEIKNVYLWISIIASLLAITIVFFILKDLIQSKKNVVLLKTLNNMVSQQKLQLEQALSTVEEKNKQQERILRAVAHDLRGPIATISMLCDLVQQDENKTSREEMLSLIKTSCNNSLELIAEILEAADQSKRKEQEKEFVSLNVLIKNAVELLNVKASEKQQAIKYELPKQDVFAMVNTEKIKRVINNLTTNAIKFSPKGTEINIVLSTDTDAAIIKVKDRGIGIPEEIKDKVFDMFTEAKRKGTAGELPYGLGLSICKQIVEAHNGSIWFESRKDIGTTFYVRIPL